MKVLKRLVAILVPEGIFQVY